MTMFRRFAIAAVAALSIWSSPAHSDCTGQFQAGAVCNNPNVGQGAPIPTVNPVIGTSSSVVTIPGRVLSSASTTVRAGINIAPGAAPTVPVNGDLWSTTVGFFGRVNGGTVGPFAGASAGSFAGVAPINIAFPSSVVTISINTNGITNALLRQGQPNSVIGNCTNVTANVADVVALASSTILAVNGAGTACGWLTTSVVFDNAFGTVVGSQISRGTSAWRASVTTLNVADFGAAPDFHATALDGTITYTTAGGTGAVSATGSPFATSIVGDLIALANGTSAGVNYVGTLTGVTDANHVTTTPVVPAALTGAAGENCHDNTAPIQATITAARALTGAKIIVPSAQIYCITKLNFTEAFYISFEGLSTVERSILWPMANVNAVIDASSAAHFNMHNMTIGNAGQLALPGYALALSISTGVPFNDFIDIGDSYVPGNWTKTGIYWDRVSSSKCDKVSATNGYNAASGASSRYATAFTNNNALGFSSDFVTTYVGPMNVSDIASYSCEGHVPVASALYPAVLLDGALNVQFFGGNASTSYTYGYRVTGTVKNILWDGNTVYADVGTSPANMVGGTGTLTNAVINVPFDTGFTGPAYNVGASNVNCTACRREPFNWVANSIIIADTADGLLKSLTMPNATMLQGTASAPVATTTPQLGVAGVSAGAIQLANASLGGAVVAIKASFVTTNYSMEVPASLGTNLMPWISTGLTTAPTTTVQLSVGGGGTGLTSGTSGGVPYFNTTTSMATSTLLAANALMVGGGVGAAPVTVTTGSGVLTALSNTAGGAGGFALASTNPYNLTGPITSVGNATSIASQTGTGTKFVVDTGPTIAGLTVTGSFTATGLVTNADLANASTTVNSQTCTLGSTCTVTAAPSGSAGGDLTGTYPNPTLAAIISAGGPTGSATVAPIVTYDAKGRLTAVSSATVTPAIGSITGLAANIATFLASPTSANFAAAMSNKTGTAGFTVFSDSPVFTTNITVPLVIGGTSASSSLTLESTSGAGTTDSIVFNTGSQVTAWTMATGDTSKGGALFYGTTNPCNAALDGCIGTITKTSSGIAAWYLGQSGSNAIQFVYTSNATPANGTAQIVMAGYANPLSIDASILNLQANSGGYIMTGTLDAASSTGGILRVGGGASVAKRFWIPAISASAGLQTAVLCQSSGGEMIADSVACLASGSQFKNILGPMPDGALAKLATLPIDRWRYKAEGNFTSDDWTRERIGPIAQDVAAMDQRLAGYDSDGNVRTYSTEQLLGYTIKAVQELKAANDNLQTELAGLKAANAR